MEFALDPPLQHGKVGVSSPWCRKLTGMYHYLYHHITDIEPLKSGHSIPVHSGSALCNCCAAMPCRYPVKHQYDLNNCRSTQRISTNMMAMSLHNNDQMHRLLQILHCMPFCLTFGSSRPVLYSQGQTKSMLMVAT